MEHQDYFYFCFEKELLKKFRISVVDQNAVTMANLNIDHSDSRNDTRSPNERVEESLCVEEQDHLEGTNTEEQNSQNGPIVKWWN